MTKLDKPLRRELLLGEHPYTLTIDPEGFKLVEKGKRKGLALSWNDLVSGDAALAAALRASLASGDGKMPRSGEHFEFVADSGFRIGRITLPSRANWNMRYPTTHVTRGVVP